MITVLLVDDHRVVREGLRAFLDVQDDLEVVGEAADGRTRGRADVALQPDVVLLDLKMPGMDGLEVLRELAGLGTTSRVLVLTSYTDPASVVPALRAGASGFLDKDVDPAALAHAIRSVHHGQVAAGAGDDRGAARRRPAARAADHAHPARARRARRDRARTVQPRDRPGARPQREDVKTHVSAILMKLGGRPTAPRPPSTPPSTGSESAVGDRRLAT